MVFLWVYIGTLKPNTVNPSVRTCLVYQRINPSGSVWIGPKIRSAALSRFTPLPQRCLKRGFLQKEGCAEKGDFGTKNQRRRYYLWHWQFKAFNRTISVLAYEWIAMMLLDFKKRIDLLCISSMANPDPVGWTLGPWSEFLAIKTATRNTFWMYTWNTTL
jgi:hypothetical protein